MSFFLIVNSIRNAVINLVIDYDSFKVSKYFFSKIL